ncbi:uncharacterized protein [Spinacia oleracea]|uniref:RNase H type-1 domain-containing protein n=1 Tax=Spinacia oleracea TaxID=3562 RepID=A0ABM3QZH7_SPIOL|nr:uncharacterized protein LOC130463619 [Spinacia oleracea]
MKNATVASNCFWDGLQWKWTLSWARPLRVRDNQDLHNLLQLLSGVSLSPGDLDTFIWAPSKKGCFSVKSFSFELAKSEPNFPHKNFTGIWKGLVPYRVEIFVWLTLQGKLNTKDKLCHLGIIGPTTSACSLCNSTLESCQHLFLHCSIARDIWCWWLNIWHLHWCMPPSVQEAYNQWAHPKCGAFFKKGWGDEFPYSLTDIIREPKCLNWEPQRSGLHTQLIAAPKQLWLPPPPYSFKWNVDASLKPNESKSAIGGVLRNHHGEFKCLFSSPIPFMETNHAETFAIYRAVKISLGLEMVKHRKLIVESDSANAVLWCNGRSKGPWNLNFIINFIRCSMKNGNGVEIVYKSRESNMVADSMAKRGLTRSDEFIAWM